MTSGPFSGPVRHPWITVTALFTVIGFLVVLPWTRGGSLLLLDWARAPHARLPRAVWGLDGSVTAAVPFHLGTAALDGLLGVNTTSWLVILAVFPLAGIGMSRLVRGSLTARCAAGLTYALSPMVYERIWAGQVAFLLAYALLPWAAASVLAAPGRRWPEKLYPAVWFAVLTGLAPHFGIFITVLIAGVVLAHRLRPAVLAWAAAILAVGTVASAYLIVGSTEREGAIVVGHADLHAFRSVGDQTLGLFVNLAGQYGFWRREALLPKDDVGGWVFFLTAILLLAAIGAVATWRSGERRRDVVALLVAGAVGYVLALGDAGPFARAFVWSFDHVPGFAILREPQKSLALFALMVASFIGWGTDAVLQSQPSGRRRAAIGAAALILPVAYNPSLFLGLRHRLATSAIPSGWREADAVMGRGEGKVLALPWHQYLGFPFTRGRIVSNPMATSFRRDVVSGDNIEMPGLPSASGLDRSKYLEFLYTQGPSIHSFGQLVAPLGVEFVALAKTVDWRAFDWLDHQTDLDVVLDRPSIRVYRNRAAEPRGYARSRRLHLPDWGAVVAEAERGTLGGATVTVASAGPGPVVVPDPTSSVPSSGVTENPARAVTPSSPVRFAVAKGTPADVVLPEPFDTSWRGGRGTYEQAGGVVAVTVPAGRTEVTFGFWRRLRAAYALGVIVLVATWLSATIGRCRYGPRKRFMEVSRRET